MYLTREEEAREKEFFVNVFHIMTSLDDGRHTKYLSALGFDQASGGIIRYSLGIPLLLYDTNMSFEGGKENQATLREM